MPVIAVSLAAVACFLPRSPGRRQGRADVPGTVLSGGGLAAVTYGVIAAGQQGWASGTALAVLAAGAGLLTVFWRREQRAGRPAGGPARQPLIDPALFASRGFTAGTALVTVTALVMFGLSCAMPQYFRDVAGASPIGAGVQLLPVAGGSAAGLLAATRLQRPRRSAARTRLSPRAAAAAGFAIMAAGTGAGAATVPGSSAAFTAVWFAVTGFGLGFIPPSAMNAALAAVPPERAGSGAALTSALRLAGATIGVALLGTLPAAGYRSRIQAAALPPTVRGQAGRSVTAGLAATRARHSPALLHAVRAAFTSGLDTTLLACSAIAVVAASLAVAFLPRRAR